MPMNNEKNKNHKIILAIILPIVAVFLITVGVIGCKRRLPIWRYNNGNPHPLIVDNWSVIDQYSSYTKEELEPLLDALFCDHIDLLLKTVSFSKIRETYQGYYTIIQLQDRSRVFLFFDDELNLCQYFFVYHFASIHEADDLIPNNYYKNSEMQTTVSQYELLTGADWHAFQFKDGIVAVLYSAANDLLSEEQEETHEKQENERIEGYRISIYYNVLRWNPIARYELGDDLKYIYPVDRNY